MSNIKVEQATDETRNQMPALTEMDRVMEQVRQRAFELFSGRGLGEGRALDDWLAAEREICSPAAELAEEGPNYVLSVSLPGFEPGEVEVTASPSGLLVHARKETSLQDATVSHPKVCWSEMRSTEVYRRIDLPTAIDVDATRASLRNGILKIEARKAGEPSRAVAGPVAA